MTSEKKTATDETQGSEIQGTPAPANGQVARGSDKKMKPLVSTLQVVAPRAAWVTVALAIFFAFISVVSASAETFSGAMSVLSVALALFTILLGDLHKKEVIDANKRVAGAVGKNTRTEVGKAHKGTRTKVGKAVGNAHKGTRTKVGKAHKDTRTKLVKAHKDTRTKVGEAVGKAHKDTRTRLVKAVGKAHKDTRTRLVKAHEDTRTRLVKAHEDTRAEIVKAHEDTRTAVRVIATTSAVFSAIGVIEGNLTTIGRVMQFLPTVSGIGDDAKSDIVSRLNDCKKRTATLIKELSPDAKQSSHGES